MISLSEWCLVIGAGSIGERYIRNLWSLGAKNIGVLRSRNLPFRDIGNAQVRVITSWKEADELKPKVAFICTPTFLHLTNALDCVQRGIHVLVEKPLSHSTEGLSELKKKARERNVLVQVGYMMRHHPFLKKVQEMTRSGRYGNLLYMTSYWGEYLPDWHPWEDYRKSYAARKDMGGGVALTLSHDLDVSNWIAGGVIIQSKSVFNHRSALEVDVESGADFILNYSNGITSHVHLNYFQKVRERRYLYIFDQAAIDIDFFSNRMTIKTQSGDETESLSGFDRNELFLTQLQDFFSNIKEPGKASMYIEESEHIINICAGT